MLYLVHSSLGLSWLEEERLVNKISPTNKIINIKKIYITSAWYLSDIGFMLCFFTYNGHKNIGISLGKHTNLDSQMVSQSHWVQMAQCIDHMVTLGFFNSHFQCCHGPSAKIKYHITHQKVSLLTQWRIKEVFSTQLKILAKGYFVSYYHVYFTCNSIWWWFQFHSECQCASGSPQ